MEGTLMSLAILLLIALTVSTLIIFVVTKILGEREGLGTAVGAALVGTIVYALAYFFLGQGLLAAVVGGFVWLLALGGLYNMGWLKSLGVAIIVWIAAAFVGTVVPTLLGPL